MHTFPVCTHFLYSYGHLHIGISTGQQSLYSVYRDHSIQGEVGCSVIAGVTGEPLVCVLFTFCGWMHIYLFSTSKTNLPVIVYSSSFSFN